MEKVFIHLKSIQTGKAVSVQISKTQIDSLEKIAQKGSESAKLFMQLCD